MKIYVTHQALHPDGGVIVADAQKPEGPDAQSCRIFYHDGELCYVYGSGYQRKAKAAIEQIEAERQKEMRDARNGIANLQAELTRLEAIDVPAMVALAEEKFNNRKESP